MLLRLLRRTHAHVAMHLGYAMLGLGCLLWSGAAWPLTFVVSGARGIWLGRRVASLGFRAYLAFLDWIGVARFDLRELDALRNAGPLIIAPNHPGLLDALMVISRLPNVACVLKASLLDNPLWGAGSRLAGYIRNDWFIGSITLAVQDLQQGGYFERMTCQAMFAADGIINQMLMGLHIIGSPIPWLADPFWAKVEMATGRVSE